MHDARIVEVFEKLTSACLSKFHEKLCYYLLVIYIKMFETIVVLTYVYSEPHPLAKFSWLCYITLYNTLLNSDRLFGCLWSHDIE